MLRIMRCEEGDSFISDDFDEEEIPNFSFLFLILFLFVNLQLCLMYCTIISVGMEEERGKGGVWFFCIQKEASVNRSALTYTT